MPKYKNSLLHWIVLFIVVGLFGLAVFANFWVYNLDMAQIYSQ